LTTDGNALKANGVKKKKEEEKGARWIIVKRKKKKKKALAWGLCLTWKGVTSQLRSAMRMIWMETPQSSNQKRGKTTLGTPDDALACARRELRC
jgi:hypothetical protein